MASISNARAQAELLGIKTDLDSGGGAAIIRVYGGTPPANLDTTHSETLLAELTMSDPSFADPVDATGSATMTANAISNDSSANATGTPTFARLFESTGTTAYLQVSAAIGSGEMNFTAGTVAGAPVSVTSLVLTRSES